MFYKLRYYIKLQIVTEMCILAIIKLKEANNDVGALIKDLGISKSHDR